MHLLEAGKQVNEFFNVIGSDELGRKKYALKPMDQYAREHQTDEQPSKQYFKATKLPDIIKSYTLPKKITTQPEVDKGKFTPKLYSRSQLNL
jgi:dual specificity protein kinase YAK1